MYLYFLVMTVMLMCYAMLGWFVGINFTTAAVYFLPVMMLWLCFSYIYQGVTKWKSDTKQKCLSFLMAGLCYYFSFTASMRLSEYTKTGILELNKNMLEFGPAMLSIAKWLIPGCLVALLAVKAEDWYKDWKWRKEYEKEKKERQAKIQMWQEEGYLQRCREFKSRQLENTNSTGNVDFP